MVVELASTVLVVSVQANEAGADDTKKDCEVTVKAPIVALITYLPGAVVVSTVIVSNFALSARTSVTAAVRELVAASVASTTGAKTAAVFAAVQTHDKPAGGAVSATPFLVNVNVTVASSALPNPAA